MNLKTLILSSFVFLVSLPAFAGEEGQKNWWCESRAGYCYRTKDECDDTSCYWKKHAWITAWKERGEERSQAFSTEAICKRFRPSRRERTDRCKYSD